LNVGTTFSGNAYVEGCAWAGNNLSGSTPLGWICFSDPGDNGNTMANVNGVATSTTYLNALSNTSYASIINQENWKCSNDATKDCLPSTEEIDCGIGNTCDIVADDAWKLGFPISDPLDKDASGWSTDSDAPRIIPPSSWWGGDGGKSMDGCFNCHEEYEYRCTVSNALCGPSGSNICVEPQTCDIKGVYKNCDNCLEYFYYPGRCELPGEIPGIPSSYGTHTVCETTADCIATESCVSISTCAQDIDIECKDQPTICNLSIPGDTCEAREIGELKKMLGGYNCGLCDIEDYDNTCGLNTYQGNINSCGVCKDVFYTPGVMIDNKHGNLANGEQANLCGWGWNSYNGGSDGFGWVQFGPRVVTSTKPYIFADSGNIYSQKNISGYLPPGGKSNSSYLIESGGSIRNFISSSTLANLYQGELPYSSIIQFPSLTNGKYSNALGSIDYLGLINDFDPGLANINKYGSTVVPRDTFFYEPLMNGEVYYIDKNMTLTNPMDVTIQAGVGNEDASGVIVINGTLYTNRNILHESAVYNNLKNIPSVVWIIKGDFLISPNVTTLEGTFIVLGDDNSPSCDPNTLPFACGQINTCYYALSNPGNPASCANNQLVVRGNVLAKYFGLNRTHNTNSEPSELFINDGRLQANPPAGLEDFSNMVPRFTEN